jgi:hypothetical protein
MPGPRDRRLRALFSACVADRYKIRGTEYRRGRAVSVVFAVTENEAVTASSSRTQHQCPMAFGAGWYAVKKVRPQSGETEAVGRQRSSGPPSGPERLQPCALDHWTVNLPPARGCARGLETPSLSETPDGSSKNSTTKSRA